MIRVTGYYHVPTILAYPGLGRPRDRNAPQRSIRTELHMAKRTEPFQWKIVYDVVGLYLIICTMQCRVGCREYVTSEAIMDITSKIALEKGKIKSRFELFRAVVH
jgi:hypothetical protein